MSILFEETSIGAMRLANRFVRSATYESRAAEDGGCTPELAEFIAETARGGAGLVITGHAYVMKNGKAGPGQTGVYGDELIPGLKQVAEKVHEAGGKVALQLSHAGGNTRPEWISGPMLAPSTFRSLHGEMAGQMSAAEIEETIEAFVRAGVRARAAGFDAVQLHASHAQLLHQFISPFWNRRTDAYGGSTEKRLRAVAEICGGLRRELGAGFPVLVKLSSGDFMEGGLEVVESARIAKRLCEAGTSAIEVTGGSRYPGAVPHIRSGIVSEKDEAYFAENALRIKAQIDAPLILVGGIRSFGVAESLVERGVADCIAMCRPFICEPHIVKRWKSGDRSRARCVSDNRCFFESYRAPPLRCLRGDGIA
ncbi:MAG: NADH:flavin oxidoreductase [Desulfobacteraceae bacterium]|nr:NADH:flavin oxidoreductase [Desulfobacteraceae bacterium]